MYIVNKKLKLKIQFPPLKEIVIALIFVHSVIILSSDRLQNKILMFVLSYFE